MDVNDGPRPLIHLYEDNADAVYIQADNGPVWRMGNDLTGSFAVDAAGWAAGDWEPGYTTGQTAGSLRGLTLVATWTATDGVRLANAGRPDLIGFTARQYLGLDLGAGTLPEVTDVTATFTATFLPPADQHATGWNWAEEATNAWFLAARGVGLAPVTVSHEVDDLNHDAAIIKVNGTEYTLTVDQDHTVRAVARPTTTPPVARHERRQVDVTVHVNLGAALAAKPLDEWVDELVSEGEIEPDEPFTEDDLTVALARAFVHGAPYDLYVDLTDVKMADSPHMHAATGAGPGGRGR